MVNFIIFAILAACCAATICLSTKDRDRRQFLKSYDYQSKSAWDIFSRTTEYEVYETMENIVNECNRESQACQGNPECLKIAQDHCREDIDRYKRAFG